MIRKTKIIATIGPATSTKEMLRRIIQRGVNVCRINFSHMSHEKAKQVISSIKEINKELQSLHLRVAACDIVLKELLAKGLHLTERYKMNEDANNLLKQSLLRAFATLWGKSFQIR